MKRRKIVALAAVLAVIALAVSKSQSHPSLIDGNWTMESLRRTFEVDNGYVTVYGDEYARGRGGILLRSHENKTLAAVYFNNEPKSAIEIDRGAPKGKLILVTLRAHGTGQEYENATLFWVIGNQIKDILTVPTRSKLADADSPGMTVQEFKANQSFYGFVWPERWGGYPAGGWTRLYSCQVHTLPQESKTRNGSRVDETWEIPGDLSSVVIREYRYDPKQQYYVVKRSVGRREFMLGN